VSSWIELDCGCRLNEAFVLGMCMTHAHELQRKKAENDKAYEAFVGKVTAPETAVGCTCPQPLLHADGKDWHKSGCPSLNR
jgi:hypothetical protein